MRYAFIEQQRAHHCVQRMCWLLDVSRAGYYEWRGRPLSARSQGDIELRAAIVQAHLESAAPTDARAFMPISKMPAFR